MFSGPLPILFSSWLNTVHFAFIAEDYMPCVQLTGGFVAANELARAALARSLSALGGKAHFLHHADFLGALGALVRSLSCTPKQLHAEWPTVEWITDGASKRTASKRQRPESR